MCILHTMCVPIQYSKPRSSTPLGTVDPAGVPRWAPAAVWDAIATNSPTWTMPPIQTQTKVSFTGAGGAFTWIPWILLLRVSWWYWLHVHCLLKNLQQNYCTHNYIYMYSLYVCSKHTIVLLHGPYHQLLHWVSIPESTGGVDLEATMVVFLTAVLVG